MTKLIVMTLVKIRWVWFHINPRYIKFYMDENQTEAHFHDRKTNTILSNYTWVD